MASSTLIGTAPDQVPTNGDLGDLAFQNKENINFTGGRGALEHLDVTAIAKKLVVNPLDVFIYDTSKDSDGGAWRYRTNHCSWYNETLNTTTRGPRKEFPSVAVFVATSNTVTIYDGDDADLPMWMVFEEGAQRYLNTNGVSVFAVKAINAKMVVTGFRVGITDFAADRGYSYEQSYYNWSNLPIVDRNKYGALALWRAGSYLLSNYTRGVALAVLPNAELDPLSGLPNPTIVLGVGLTTTPGGVHIIKDNGQIKYGTKNNDSWRCDNVTIDNSLTIWSGEEIDWAYGGLQPVSKYPWNTITSIGVGSIGYPQQGALFSNSYGVSTSLIAINGGGFLKPTTTKTGIAVGHSSGGYSFNTGGVTLVEEHVDRSKTMMAYITSKYNSGWVVGKGGSWLSDGDPGPVVTSNLVQNGTFDSNSNNWSAVSSTVSVSAGKATVTSTTSGLYGITQIISGLIQGKTYTFGVDVTANNSASSVRIQISGIGSVRDSQIAPGVSNYRISGSFIANSDTTTLEIFDYGSPGVGVAFTADNVTFKIGDNNKADAYSSAEINGAIVKTPVAVGSDILAYSNFSTSANTILVPRNMYDLNNKSFTMMCWIRTTQTSGEECPISTGDYNNANKARILYVNSGQLGFAGWSNDWLSGRYINDGKWHLIAITAQLLNSGIYRISAYDNGELASSINISNLATFSNTVIDIGGGTLGVARHVKDAIALARVSPIAIDPAQMRKIYLDEKPLFEPNTKAFLNGTSNTVTALAYDSDTDILHIGTYSGRSSLKGLKRVSETDNPVNASLHAANGLVVEG